MTSHSPENHTQFEEIRHQDLIDMFYESEGDLDIGRELSSRLFKHAGIDIDLSRMPLLKSDGNQVIEDGVSLTMQDYVNYAASNHFYALESILSFLLMQPGERDYEDSKKTMLDKINRGNNLSG